MARDFWLDDDQPGCLECGSLRFKASRLSGVCAECMSDISSIHHEDYYDFAQSADDGDDIPWQENF